MGLAELKRAKPEMSLVKLAARFKILGSATRCHVVDVEDVALESQDLTEVGDVFGCDGSVAAESAEFPLFRIDLDRREAEHHGDRTKLAEPDALYRHVNGRWDRICVNTCRPDKSRDTPEAKCSQELGPRSPWPLNRLGIVFELPPAPLEALAPAKIVGRHDPGLVSSGVSIGST